MFFWILLPFLLQTAFMTADECIFHRKRALPLWERIGHPLDTLSVLALYVFLFLEPYSCFHLKWFIALSVLSCLLITKDEFVHKHHCEASEQWLHAVLFINHPIWIATLGLCWPALHGQPSFSWIQAWMPSQETLKFALGAQFVLTFLFFSYQVIYWNFLWKKPAA